MTRSRRDILKTLGTVGAMGGTVVIAGCATGSLADGKAEARATPFTVANTTIPIIGSREVFPVRRIYCIGRNYAAHAREMGSDPTR